MHTETLSIEGAAEQKRKNRKKRLLLLLLISAHVDFYFAQSLLLPLGIEQLFMFGYALIITDTICLTFFIVKILGHKSAAQ